MAHRETRRRSRSSTMATGLLAWPLRLSRCRGVLGGNPAIALSRRSFQKNTYLAAKKDQKGAQAKQGEGRDPFALFKEAIASRPAEGSNRSSWTPEQRSERRAAYSRARMLEVCPREPTVCTLPQLARLTLVPSVAAPPSERAPHEADQAARRGKLLPCHGPPFRLRLTAGQPPPCAAGHCRAACGAAADGEDSRLQPDPGAAAGLH